MMTKILIVVAALVAIPFILALFIKNEYSISREITINKPKEVVFDYIRHLKNQDNYSKWVRTDPAMKKVFKGTDGKVGFVYAWDSKDKKAGKGEQEIIGITEGDKVDIEVRFEKPFANVAKTPFVMEAISSNQTKVKWGMVGRNKYPMNFMNLVMDKMLGKDIETSLVTLKGVLESKDLSNK